MHALLVVCVCSSLSLRERVRFVAIMNIVVLSPVTLCEGRVSVVVQSPKLILTWVVRIELNSPPCAPFPGDQCSLFY